MNELLEPDRAEDSATFRQKIARLEEVSRNLPQVDMNLQHQFADGIYARTGTIPAGVTIVGKIHKTRHMWILLKGAVTVSTEFGQKDYQAPAIVVAEPGEKRAIYAHTECLWTNIHATHETDPEKIEAEVIAPTYEDLEVALLQRSQPCGLPPP